MRTGALLRSEHICQLRGFIGVLVFAAFVAAMLNNWRQLLEFSWRFNLTFLALSAVALLFTRYLDVLGWHRIVIHLGGSCTFRESARIWLYSNLARYLPGSLWHAAGRVVLCRDAGIPAVIASLGVALEFAFLLLSHALVIVVTWPWWMYRSLPDAPWPLSAVVIIGALVIIHPGVLRWLMTQYAIRNTQTVGGRRSAVGGQLQYRATLHLLAIYVAQALLIGLAFHFLVQAVTPWPLHAVPFAVGAFALAWLIGFVSFFAPGGLGVREGVLAYLLAPAVTAPIAILIAVLARVWAMVGELLCITLIRLSEWKSAHNRSLSE